MEDRYGTHHTLPYPYLFNSYVGVVVITHVDDRAASMVMNRIQSNRMPTDGGVRGGRGAEEDILFRRCTYRTKTFYIVVPRDGDIPS